MLARHAFHYRQQQLYCEAVPLSRLVAETGTPVYVYSKAELVHRATMFRDAMASYAPPGMACYATKANLNLVILRLLAELGLGAEVTSGGELQAALQVGFSPERIVFSGVGKRPAELRDGLRSGIRAFHVESTQELERLGRIAQAEQQIAKMAVRVNPNVHAPTHPNISTGQAFHKFGVPYDQALTLMTSAASHPWLHPVGLAAHIGSQIRSLTPFTEAAQVLLSLAAEVRHHDIDVDYLDLGGGLAVDYAKENTPNLPEWVDVLSPPVNAAGYQLLLEPGRALVGPAGALLTAVEYTKNAAGDMVVVVDAAMNDFLRPALYQARHPILPLHHNPTVGNGDWQSLQPGQTAIVVGPVCETTDQLGSLDNAERLVPGNYLAILLAGAYGFAMSSQYNGRPRPAEVLVADDSYWIIRRREDYQDLWYHCPDHGIVDNLSQKGKHD
ncbi:MAG: diaminopimelate decarboxylase [Candidatus Promineifilaceae bacterium]|nr:diaminopimelate decarboxylase [Candidatus Promineifilaceae bacterium]